MKVILTSSLGGSMKVDGRRIPIPLMGENGQLDQIEVFWRENSRILLISGTPDDYTRNDAIINCLKESFRMSGLEFSFFEMCDARTEGLVERLSEMDVILLGGGHVPTQNAFMKRIGLKERLRNYEGLIIGGSAGSMNCAELVYAGPESEEEAVDPNYQRWISGLGMTQVNILPHFQRLKGVVLGGLRLYMGKHIASKTDAGNRFAGMENLSLCKFAHTIYCVCFAENTFFHHIIWFADVMLNFHLDFFLYTRRPIVLYRISIFTTQ